MRSLVGGTAKQSHTIASVAKQTPRYKVAAFLLRAQRGNLAARRHDDVETSQFRRLKQKPERLDFHNRRSPTCGENNHPLLCLKGRTDNKLIINIL
jgi:hypothetical protein